jgi:hypothetical protein
MGFAFNRRLRADDSSENISGRSFFIVNFPQEARKEMDPTEIPAPEDYQASRLLAYLGEEGCPVCRDASENDEQYFFWFLHENYAFAETLESLTRSFGFCAPHGAQAMRNPVAQSPLAVVHEILSHRIAAILSREATYHARDWKKDTGPSALDRCPACRNRDEKAERTISSLSAAITSPAGLDRYGQPGLLCFPHLQASAPKLPASTLLRVLNLHERALAHAGERMGKGALRLVAGEEDVTDLYPPWGQPVSPPKIRDPVGEFLDSMTRTDACPVCEEVARAWAEWMEGMDEMALRGWDIEDIVPICPDHLRTIVGARSPSASASLRKALGVVSAQVQLGVEALSLSPATAGRPVLSRLANALGGFGKRRRTALEPIVRPLYCPVCNRLAVARDRILALLFALLESSHHRSTFERGYGLCLKHFSSAMALHPSRSIRAILAEVEVAKLSCLEWELEESLRKDAWMYRPEESGTEHTAWRRAVLRFSGGFPEREP